MKYITILAFLAILSSCKNMVQVMETRTTNTNIVDNEYVFENDSIKITYNFWREYGALKFTVYNKLSTPLYIDWKKSSYINNTVKRNYWEDEENSVSDTYSLYGYSKSVGVSKTKSIKPEKITFIPPKSNFIKEQFFLLPDSEFNVKYEIKNETVSKLREGKIIEIKEKSFSKSESPLLFRNFLTLSFSEDFDSEFYIDNEFYLSKIFEIDSRDFTTYARDPVNKSFYKRDEFGRKILLSPYYSGASFYIRLKSE